MRDILWISIVWLGFLGIGFTNGVLRELVLSPRLGRALALPLSGLLGGFAIAVLIYAAIPLWGTRTAAWWWGLGAVWAGGAIVFETAFSRVRGLSWGATAAAYDPRSGNLWILVILVLFLGPRLAAALRGSLA